MRPRLLTAQRIIRADDHPDPLAELRRLHAASQQRFALFRRFLPGSDSRCGVFDRDVIEAAISARLAS
jgi:hypothetical protein